MRVAGELRVGQLLITPDNAFGPRGSSLCCTDHARQHWYGRCDGPKDGTRPHSTMRADDPAEP